jgi:hypothetical protein
MVKKKQVSNEPVISNIPIPASDNPMVIDLPDGQKIVLGKLSPGSVIEVATWRGTGRPDSRTNRFMLGVSDASSPATPTQAAQAQVSAKSKFTLPWKREKMTTTVEKKESTNFLSRIIGGTVSSFSKALKRTQDLTPVETTTDLEINAWIESLSRQVKEEPKVAPPRKAVAKRAPVTKKAAPAKKTASTVKRKSK